MKWTKSNIPEYESDRVKVFVIWDNRKKQLLSRKQVIAIDDEIVNSEVFLERKHDESEGDFQEFWCPFRKKEREQWDDWVATLED